MINYEEFGQLRYLDFFPKTALYFCDDIGGTQTCTGSSCIEEGRDIAFVRPAGEPRCTSEVAIEFGDKVTADQIKKLLDTIGLPLQEGMSREEVRAVLGEEDPTQVYSPWFARFIVGDGHKYYVFCAFNPSKPPQGLLCGLRIARKDLTDKNNERLAAMYGRQL